MVQYQMDIVGLTQMFFKVGAHGLKQIALAGIDVHTIGALLTLGNLVPASVEFRRKLDICRTKQRKSFSWIYKTIEIGTSTNFLADELLKTRAGEGALSLFTAIMPVLSENCYTGAILSLFQHSKIEADSTPGIGQLQRLRTSVLAFTNAMDVKNKIMQYHLLFRQYSDQYQEPNNAIPNADTIARLVQASSKIKMDEVGYKLLYRGTQGAAWTAAYTWDVPGLGVCMIAPSSNGETPVAISADFETAQVLIYVAAENGDIELCKRGSVDDLTDKSAVSPNQIEWNIDCNAVNYFAAHHPKVRDPSLLRKISEFVGAKTLDAVAAISHELTYSVNVKRSKFNLPICFKTYQLSILSSVQKRCLDVL